MIQRQLFESEHLRLTSIDPQEDGKIESAWTYDLDYAQALMEMPARPMGAAEMKKYHEQQQKQVDEKGDRFYFAIRLKEGERLAGFIRFPIVFWIHSSARLHLAIADPSILEHYGREALELALVYGFRELNLYRIETEVAETQADMIHLLEEAGFLQEVRRRQAIFRHGEYCDSIQFGLLQAEWRRLLDREAAL